MWVSWLVSSVSREPSCVLSGLHVVMAPLLSPSTRRNRGDSSEESSPRYSSSSWSSLFAGGVSSLPLCWAFCSNLPSAEQRQVVWDKLIDSEDPQFLREMGSVGCQTHLVLSLSKELAEQSFSVA